MLNGTVVAVLKAKELTHVFRGEYDGCKENGSTVPDGSNLAVEITETNPYDVTTNQSGDQFVDVELLNE